IRRLDPADLDEPDADGLLRGFRADEACRVDSQLRGRWMSVLDLHEPAAALLVLENCSVLSHPGCCGRSVAYSEVYERTDGRLKVAFSRTSLPVPGQPGSGAGGHDGLRIFVGRYGWGASALEDGSVSRSGSTIPGSSFSPWCSGRSPRASSLSGCPGSRSSPTS